jgi:hypothetical protein
MCRYIIRPTDAPVLWRRTLAPGAVSNLQNTRVNLPRVHIAGSDAHCDAHIELGPHGVALFLAPDAEYPMLDIDGTPQQLDESAMANGMRGSRAESKMRPASVVERYKP